jgi:hypothetical protein
MTVEVDIKEIKELLSALNSKIDMLIENREILAVMMLAERSLKEFFEVEPDIYSIDDINRCVGDCFE